MAEPIIVTPNSMPDPDGCLPGTRQEMAKFVAEAISVTFVNDSFSLFNKGQSTPAPEDQNRPWLRFDNTGYCLGWYFFFNGKWVRQAPYPIDTIAYYQGPASYFDGTGKGMSGTQAEGWCVANSQNGTRDLRDQFIVTAKQYKDGRWRSDIDPSNADRVQGGDSQVTLNLNNLPPFDRTIPIGSGTGGNNRFVYGSNSNSGTYDLTIVSEGQNRPVPFDILPPFFVCCAIQWRPLN